MIDQPINKGDVVDYHGSQTYYHGRYIVTAVHDGVRGYDGSTCYQLSDPLDINDYVLWNVGRRSLTLVSTGG
jgi:hypothetical protein